MMQLFTNHKQQGQGLIEVLIVVLFISVGVVGLIKFQSYLAYNSALAQQQSDAALITLSKIETLRDFQVINTASGYSAYQDIASGSGSSTVGNTTYNLTWTITAYTSPTYKTIDVTTSWADRYGNSQSVRLTTQVAGVDPASSGAIM